MRRSGEDGLTIGEVARRAGIQASAIRYYERAGVLPPARRAGGRRIYDESILHWLAVVRLAAEAGFTIAEIRALVAGFEVGARPGPRWRVLAARKLAQVEALMARVERMRALLRRALACGCLDLRDCVRILGRSGERAGVAPAPAGRSRR
ncbi:MAG TPA: MerR family transcriptional regulator [Gemmatimonadales bacterium]|nr:MerR family transcriptional regulator [Gemmatimonadales bacterium]